MTSHHRPRLRGWAFVVILAGLAVYFSVGRYGVLHYLELRRERQQLQAEIARLQREKAELNAKADRLSSDLKEIERVAREKYHMGKADETIFVVPEK